MKYIELRLNRKYWYKFYIGECPVCGKDKSYCQRIYGEKPKDRNEIFVYLSDIETYDHCLER